MTPLERAARALVVDLTRQANLDGPDAPHIYDDALPESVGIDGRVDCTALLRAVIEAIREPSEEMLAAVQDHDNYWGYLLDGSPSGPRDCYTAMIDALLEEGR